MSFVNRSLLYLVPVLFMVSCSAENSASVGSSVAPSFDVNNFCSDELKVMWNKSSGALVDAIESKLDNATPYPPSEVIACNIWTVESSRRLKKKCEASSVQNEMQLAVAGMQTFWRLAFKKTEAIVGDSKMDIATASLGLKFKMQTDAETEKIISLCESKYEAFMLGNFEDVVQ